MNNKIQKQYHLNFFVNNELLFSQYFKININDTIIVFVDFKNMIYYKDDPQVSNIFTYVKDNTNVNRGDKMNVFITDEDGNKYYLKLSYICTDDGEVHLNNNNKIKYVDIPSFFFFKIFDKEDYVEFC